MFPTCVLQPCLEFSQAVTRLGVNGLFQSTLLITLGLAIGWAVRSKGAAVQSAVYRLALATALACPVVSLCLAAVGVPGMYLNLRILPTPGIAHAVEMPTTNTIATRAGPPANTSLVAVPSQDTGSNWSEPVDRHGSSWAAALSTHDAIAGEPALATREVPKKVSSLDWPSLVVHGLAAAWFLGTGLLLIRLLLGWRLAVSLRRTAAPADPRTTSHCLALAERLGIRTPLVLRTPFSSSPLLLGMFRAVVLLPEEDGNASSGEVLVHELAHLVRGDVAWNLLGRVGTALWFFQPLLWLLVRRMRVSAEEVCDDYVLHLGFDRPGYARRLVDIAEQYLPAAIGVGVISPRSWVGHRVVRILDSSRQLSLYAGRRAVGIAVAASLAATLLAGMVGIGQGQADAVPGVKVMEKDRPDTSAPQPIVLSTTKQQGAAGAQNTREITVRGKVLSPGGQPVAEATVRAGVGLWAMLESIVGPNAKLPVSEVKTDVKGEFAISFTTQPYGDLSRLDRRWQNIWKETNIAASAPGYGAAWVTYKDVQPDSPITLRLVPDLPIKGRVVDAEGKPVAGLAIEVDRLWAAKDEDLTPWLMGIKEGQLPWIVVHLAPREIEPAMVGVPNQVTTDQQGRFEIKGVGRERHFALTFKSITVAYRRLGVVTRKMEAIERILSAQRAAAKEPVYGTEFTVTAAPSRPIVGTARDAKTGDLLAGVHVESDVLADSDYLGNNRVLKTTTDGNGRYRLIGMPQGVSNRLLALPNDDQPYLMRTVRVPDPKGPGPVTTDIELHRGIWITGRITDKATGQPVVSARVNYLPFHSNPFAQATPEFGKRFYGVDGDQLRYKSHADGSYRLVGLPGRAIVGAESVLRDYRVGVGYDTIQGLTEKGCFDTYTNPGQPGRTWPNVMKEINPPAGTESVKVDFEMDPGQTLHVSMVDPDGRPISGVKVDGSTSSHGRNWTTIDQSTIEVGNLSPGETRTLVFHHQTRKLGLVRQINIAEAAPRPIVVRLQPVGTLKGRLLLRDGAPAIGVGVRAELLPSRDFGSELPPVATDAQGRFEYTLLPDVNYKLRIEGGNVQADFIEGDLSVEPNQIKDLGEVTLGRREGTKARAPADSAR